ncbi:hypothetical protein MNEG_11252, partial [Monoraphidium neglectum]
MGLRLRGLVTAALLLAAVTAPLDAAVPPVAERGAKRAPRECSEAAAAGSAPVADSASFAAALRSATVARIVLTANVSLQPADFDWRARIVLRRPVAVVACGSSGGGGGTLTLDLGNNMVSRVVVADGGRLSFSGPGLALTSAAPVLRGPLWPSYNPLLLGLLDLDGGGGVELSDLKVATRSPANATMLMERYPPATRPDFAVAPGGGAVVVRSWNLSRAA